MMKPVFVPGFIVLASCAEEAVSNQGGDAETQVSRAPILFDCPAGPDADAMREQSLAASRPVSCDDGENTWTISAQ